MATVYLIDDDDSLRRALGRLLRQEGLDVRDFESAEAFLAHGPSSAAPACIVLDVSMPGLDGLTLQNHLAQSSPSVPIVFLSGRGDISMSVRAIKGGATDFLTKPVSSATLLAAVHEALRLAEQAQRSHSGWAELAGRFDSLTSREREVFGALIEGKLNKQIAVELGVVEQTVKFHRARIMERMQARTVAELMHMAARLEVDARGSRRHALALQPRS